MIKVLHPGIQPNADLEDTNWDSMSLEEIATSAYVQGLKSGAAVAKDANGKLQLADGVLTFCGFLLTDVAGYWFENKPNIAARQAAHTFGNTVIVTDHLETGIIFAPGDLLYASITEAGKLTNVEPASGNKKVVGIADSVAGGAVTELRVMVL